MDELFLPVLSHFKNDNVWTASKGRLRYRVTPEGEEFRVEIWEGPWEHDLSQIETEERFPLSEAGIGEMRQWLLSRAAEMNARPARSLEEDLKRRGGQSGEGHAAK